MAELLVQLHLEGTRLRWSGAEHLKQKKEGVLKSHICIILSLLETAVMGCLGVVLWVSLFLQVEGHIVNFCPHLKNCRPKVSQGEEFKTTHFMECQIFFVS